MNIQGLNRSQVAGLVSLSRNGSAPVPQASVGMADPVDRVDLSTPASRPARRRSPRTLSRIGAAVAAGVAAGSMFASPTAALTADVLAPALTTPPVPERVVPMRVTQAPAVQVAPRPTPAEGGPQEAADVIYRVGDQGDRIAELQGQLGDLGYYRGTRDGQFGRDLEAAVRSFQRDAGIQATGALGPQTRGAMQRARELGSSVNARFAAHQELLARAIAAEARGESYEAQVAVGATILNYARRHGRSLPSLIRSSYLASNYDGNRVFYTRPTSSIANWDGLYRAAGDALAGRSRVGPDRIHFIDNSIRPPAWVVPSSALRIGRMVFFQAR